MTLTVDARGLACPLPALHARRALAGAGPDDVVVVLATDPEAPIDLAAVAADAGRVLDVERDGATWRFTLRSA
jgi:tRNA 2-thiouridine synthesizing protein A